MTSSSQCKLSAFKSIRICSLNCRSQRSVSVSSIRSSHLPPKDLIWQKLASAVVSEPRCNSPVGEGAKRPTGCIGRDWGEWSVLIFNEFKVSSYQKKYANRINKTVMKSYLLNLSVLLVDSINNRIYMNAKKRPWWSLSSYLYEAFTNTAYF